MEARKMTRITRREAALANLVNAPLEMEISVPEKRVRDPNQYREYHLQQACIKLLRERQRYDKSLRFIAAGAAQNKLTERQRGFAKAMGWERGICDLILIRNIPFRILWCELKLPGKKLSTEQRDWFSWLRVANIPCHRIDTLSDFATLLYGFCTRDGVSP